MPRLGGDWGDCDPTNRKNRRRRCSLLVERHDRQGTTRVLVDTSPDMREQLLDAGVGHLDGVAFTHPHADHTHGIDDLRQVVFNMRRRLPVWADGQTQNDLISRFGYAFIQPARQPLPADPRPQHHHPRRPSPSRARAARSRSRPSSSTTARSRRWASASARSPISPTPSAIPDAAWPHLIERCPASSSTRCAASPIPPMPTLTLTLDWIARARPGHAVLTNMHLDMDYATLVDELPAGVEPAYDGMVLNFEA